MTATVDQSVEQFTTTPRQLFINGQWIDAASGKLFQPAVQEPQLGAQLERVIRQRRKEGRPPARAAHRAA